MILTSSVTCARGRVASLITFCLTACGLVLWATVLAGADEDRTVSPSAKTRLQVPPAAKTIIDLQPFRRTTSIPIKGADGREGRAELIDLNPNLHGWYLLRLSWPGAGDEFYHLQNPHPRTQTLLLGERSPFGLLIATGRQEEGCALWGADPRDSLAQARKSGAPYAALCGGRLYLLNPTRGHRTGLEAVTDFLRNEVPAGDRVVGFVRDTVYNYLYARRAEESVVPAPNTGSMPNSADGPQPARMDPGQAGREVKPVDLGISIESSATNALAPGIWYPAQGNPGMWISVIVPRMIAPEILSSYRDRVHEMDPVESGQLVYLIAFDLGRFDLKYSLGTEHPRVDWSEHILPQMKDASLPGPDGIGTIAPLVSTGMIPPSDEAGTVAAFTGGFKRIHGAFDYGPLAHTNHGSHYGFLQEGVLFSTLQPGLATIYAMDNGMPDMETWTAQDTKLLPGISFARQNGVPLVDGFDRTARMPVPGIYVNRWGDGNWSGSARMELRTMRAGAALQEPAGKRFLIYAFFWSATPSAMARVFQAYQCRYAMLLDMNALVHTYLAVYRRQGSQLSVQHLIQGMSEVDMTVGGKYIPRFLGYPDDRDFFYLTRKGIP